MLLSRARTTCLSVRAVFEGTHSLDKTWRHLNYKFYSSAVFPLDESTFSCQSELSQRQTFPIPVDRAVFEEMTEEYHQAPNSALPATTNPPSTPAKGWTRSHRVMHRSTGLRESIENGEYARAEVLRAELLEAGIHIKRHPIYAEAALHAWKCKPLEGRTERFYEWFRLIPNALLGRIRQGRKAIQRVRRTLFAEPNDLNTIACFGLVAARKGYGNYISIDIVTHIARFASPGISSAYFDDLERSALKFYSRFEGHTTESSRWDAEKWHNMFIRALCFAGYVDACVDRLSHISQRSPGVSILPFTWAVLLETLVQLGREDLASKVRDLRVTVPRKETPAYHNAITDSPSAAYLARTVKSYIESGRVQDLDDLRREMMKPNARADLWVFAQMKLYMERKQYIVVLRQFAHYYSYVGIPREAILPYVQEGASFPPRKYDETHPLLPIASHPRHARGVNRWPSSHTLTLVWQSLVNLAEDLHSLKTLYQSFITYVDQNRPSTSTERPPELPEGSFPNIRFQYPPVMGPDTVQFHVFIMAFARLAGADTAVQVLIDMQARGIRPDVYNWTALAGHYASRDDAERAERILERMESSVTDQDLPAKSSEAKHKNRTREGPISRKPGWMPEPNLVTYTTILRGLVDRSRFPEARRLAKRMEEAGYVPGSDEQTEMVLQLLRDRENVGRIPWSVRARWQPWCVVTDPEEKTYNCRTEIHIYSPDSTAV